MSTAVVMESLVGMVLFIIIIVPFTKHRQESYHLLR